MLQAMRDKMMGILGWVIIGLIIMTFALFGLGSYLQNDARVFAAKVNGTEITARELQTAYQQQRARLEESMGDAFNPALIDDDQLRKRALESLINRQLMLEAAQKSGFSVSDQLLAASIRSIPALQEDGQFSEEQYRQALFRVGQTPAGFEYEMRRQLTSEQLARGLSVSGFVTDSELAGAWRLQNQARDYAYLLVPASQFEAGITPDDEDIREYYENNSQFFMEPERVKLEYLRLTSSELGEGIEIDEQRLLDYYEEQKETLRKQEQRRASHILIQVEAGADDAADQAARKKADELLEQVRAGTDFAQLAKDNSDDPGSANQGGDLGFFGEGVMVPEFDAAVFSMQPGDISDPVRSQFGYHIIRLEEIQGSAIPDFEEARAGLEQDLKQQAADEQFYDLLDQLTDLTYENPDSLDAAAEALSLQIQTSDWLDARGGEGIGQYPKVLSMAFSEDVLEAGNNSEPVEVADGDVIVLRVLEREPASQSPLEDVREQIVGMLRKQQAGLEALSTGEALLEKAKNGEALETLGESEMVEYHMVEAGERSDPAVRSDIVRKVFTLPRPAEGETVTTGLTLGNGDYAVLQLIAVRETALESADEGEVARIKSGFENMRRAVDLKIMADNLRDHAKIEIPQDEE